MTAFTDNAANAKALQFGVYLPNVGWDALPSPDDLAAYAVDADARYQQGLVLPPSCFYKINLAKEAGFKSSFKNLQKNLATNN